MKIFGYNNDKQVIQVDLPIETILNHQIDPWHIDLFESDPTIIKMGEQQLHFSKLRRIAFVYHTRDKAILCMHDGSETACLESDDFQASATLRQLRKLRKNHSPLSAHLAHLYEMQSRLGSSWNESQGCGFAVASSVDAIKVFGSCVNLEQDKEEAFVLKFGSFPQFTGEMFQTVAVSTVLPPEINWVFETFNLVKPLVAGELLREVLSMREKELCQIEFNINPQLQDQLHQLARNQPGLQPEAPGWWGKFSRGETVYVGWKSCPAAKIAAIRDPYHYGFTHCSTDGVYATGVNQVTATRIALFDIARLQTRALSLHAQQQATSGHGDSLYLPVPEGWFLEPVVFLARNLNWKAWSYTKAGKTKSSTPDVPSESRALAA